MDRFQIWLEGEDEPENKHKIWRKNYFDKLNSQPDSYFVEKIREILNKHNGSIYWFKVQQSLAIPTERFEKIIDGMIQNKEIEVKEFRNMAQGRPRRVIVTYGKDVDIKPDKKIVNQSRTNTGKVTDAIDTNYYKQENKILEIIKKQGGDTTFANLDWEAERIPFLFDVKDYDRKKSIKMILKGLEAKNLITLKYVSNRYRKEPAIWITLVPPEK